MATSVSALAAPVYIYALLDPLMDEVRYIGRTGDPILRLARHVKPSALRSDSPRSRWMRGLLAHGLRPQLVVLEFTTEAYWREAERRQIAAHRAQGCALVNATDGGDTLATYATFRGRQHTPETRAKIARARQGQGRTAEQRLAQSLRQRGHPPVALCQQRQREAVTGQPKDAEHRAKIAAALRGRKRQPLSAEHRARISVALAGRPRKSPRAPASAETRARISAASKGHKQAPLTPEQRAKQIAAQTGKPMAPEARARLLTANKGRVKSAEERAKISAALKGRPKSPEVLAKLRAGRAAWQQRRKETAGAT